MKQLTKLQCWSLKSKSHSRGGITPITTINRKRAIARFVVAASCRPTRQNTAGLSSARVAATGRSRIVRSMGGGLSRLFSKQRIRTNILSGITPINSNNGMIWTSMHVLPTKVGLERIIEQVSLFLADVSQGRATRIADGTGLAKARCVSASSDILHGSRLFSSDVRRVMANITITVIISISVAAGPTEADLWCSDKQVSLFLAVGTAGQHATSRNGATRIQLYKLGDSLSPRRIKGSSTVAGLLGPFENMS